MRKFGTFTQPTTGGLQGALLSVSKPLITGTPEQGATVQGVDPQAIPAATVTARRWLLDGTAISGATGTSYAIPSTTGANAQLVFETDITVAGIAMTVPSDPVAIVAEASVSVINVTQEPSLLGIGTITAGETPMRIIARMDRPGAANLNGTSVSPAGAVVVGGSVVGANVGLSEGDEATIRVTFSAEGTADVVRDLGPVTVTAAQGSTATPAQIAHNGATLTFSDVAAQGTHADGSPWVVRSPGSQIIADLPLSAAVLRDGAFAGAPASFVSHGMEYAPGRAATQGTLAEMQATNNGLGVDQGFDELTNTSANADWDASRNIAGTSPIAMPGVYVKAVSKLTGVPSNTRPVVDAMGVFTVYDEAPGADHFRPAFASDGTPVGYGPADLNLSSLLNLDASGFAGALPSFNEALTLLTGRVNTEQNTYNVLTRNIIPAANIGFAGLSQDAYAGFHYEAVAVIALALHFDVYTAAQKRVLAGRIVQEAIDYAERAAQGGVWQENGGHCHGRKEMVTLAALWTVGLNDTRFTDALAMTTTLAVFIGGSATIWGSDRQIFQITQEDVDRVKQFPYTANQIGWPEWSSDATRDNPNVASAEEERQNTLGVDANNVTDTTGGPQDGRLIDRQEYRHIIAKASATFALVLRMAGGVSTHGGQLWFDYYDRHMTARIDNGATLPEGVSNDIHPFTLWAWENHRANYGPVWEAPSVSTPANVNLVPNGNFDSDPPLWGGLNDEVTISGSQLRASANSRSFSTVSAIAGNFAPIADDTATYEVLINVSRAGSQGKRVQLSPECFDGPTLGATPLGETVPDRVGGNITIDGAGTFGGTFTVPAGTTHVRPVLRFVEAGADMDIDDYIIRPVT